MFINAKDIKFKRDGFGVIFKHDLLRSYGEGVCIQAVVRRTVSNDIHSCIHHI